MRLIAFCSFSLGFAGNANAHVGHLGELAGHSHWIGIGAIAVAGVIAATLGKNTNTDDDKEAEVTDQADEETQGEAA